MCQEREKPKKSVDNCAWVLTQLEKCGFSGVVEIIFQDGGVRGANRVKREPVENLLAASSDSKQG